MSQHSNFELNDSLITMLENKDITTKSQWEGDHDSDGEGEEDIQTCRLSNPCTPIQDFEGDIESGTFFI